MMSSSSKTDSERYYTSSEKYLLPSDEEERVRLELQHEWIKEDFNDDQLLPVGVKLKSGDKILDAGTGTGAWARDVARDASPGVQVIGIDIEGRLFPRSTPSNLSFAVHSLISLPEHWSSIFALAHSRLLVGALSPDDWRKALSEFHRVLQPGGLVILEELDAIQMFPEGLPPNPPMTAKLVKALAELHKARNIAADCFPHMTDMLLASGFEDVQVRERVLHCGPGDINKSRQTTFAGVWRGLKTPMMRGGGYGAGSTAEEYERTVDAAVAEWNSVGISHKFLAWTARKPESPRQQGETRE